MKHPRIIQRPRYPARNRKAGRQNEEDRHASRRNLFSASAVLPFAASRAKEQAPCPVIKIEVISDMSGHYRDVTGPGSVACVHHAARQFNSAYSGVTMLAADHQNKPDIGVGIAWQWFDRDEMNVIMNVPTSSVSLAVTNVVKEKSRLYVNNGAGTGEVAGEQCTPVTIHWAFGTCMLAKTTVPQIIRVSGDKWSIIYADYVLGKQIASDAKCFATEGSSKVVGEQLCSFPSTTDFLSLLLSVQASGANLTGLATPSRETIGCIRQENEFGLSTAMKLAVLLVELNDVNALGPDVGAGLYVNSTCHWDTNEGTQQFTQAVRETMPNKRPPTKTQASCYASALHQLKALNSLRPPA